MKNRNDTKAMNQKSVDNQKYVTNQKNADTQKSTDMLKTRKISVMAAVVLLLSVLFLTSCGVKPNHASSANMEEQSEQQENVWYRFTDDAGTDIQLKEQPKKVAVLFSSFADVWETAGGEIAITVGESVERGFAKQDTLLVDGGAGKKIDRELLVSYEPDFVICSADLAEQKKLAEFLNESGIPAAQFHVESLEDYLSMLKKCTDITENKNAYKLYGTDVKKRAEAIKKEANEKRKEKEMKGEKQPNILFVRAGSSDSATKAKTAEENFVCAMLKELGTYNIAENASVLLDGLSFEEILLADPDYIFISTMGKEQAARQYMDSVLNEPQWKQLKAIQSGNYTYLPKEMFQYKPNAKWDEAYQYLVDVLDAYDRTGENSDGAGEQ